MKIRKWSLIAMGLAFGMAAMAQQRTVQNRPYTDLRPFHFGISVGSHVQDLEFVNSGEQTVVAENGTSTQQIISTDQDRFDMGFNVGVLGEMRLSEHLQLRVAPTMYFGSRHIVLLNHSVAGPNHEPISYRQNMKSVYMALPVDLIFAAPRFNNHRPYMMVGMTPALNLSGKDNDYVKLKRYDTFAEVGLGCDFYLPFFKIRPELKFMYSLVNSLDQKHIERMENKIMLPYARSVRDTRSKMVVLTFYFE
ncbi:MAG: PorT family protein [Prevotella salivae]|jgi:porT protein|uniref:Outer membrane protein beta-barrel domain protein n=1 Tax=Segatella salivae F0493 TaxID=1395125 RepID=U2LCU5_9BACT|nr:porin family protein [Segatella salivae]ERK02328.1 outer membrane protein beta-barrel domain protein [Segatella salivae F0493]MBF1550821.1 PorT family protein [Segatella salivae]